MKILHVVNIYFVLPYFLGDQLRHFHDKGYEISVICSPSPELESYAKLQSFEYKEVSILRKISILKDFQVVREICNYIKQNKIEVVVGHTPKGALLSMIAAFIQRVPKRIYFRHGLVYETSTGLKRILLKMMDKLTAYLSSEIICVSPSIYKRSLEDKLNKASKQRILANGTCNGINTLKFDSNNVDEKIIEELLCKYQISKDSFIIGFTGRLVKDKGIIELIKAFDLFNNIYPNSILLLVGLFEERDALPSSVIENIRINKSIICTGYIDYKQIVNYYYLMNLFILPSYREGFPTSVLEASAMKLPIITTKVTGCIDSIEEKKTGLFVEHDPKSIFNALKQMYLDRNMMKNFGEAGRQFVIENFEEHIIWQEIEQMYRSKE